MLGKLWALLALESADEFDEPGTAATWTYYNAPDPEDAWNGYEAIDGFENLDEAKAHLDAQREENLRIARDLT